MKSFPERIAAGETLVADGAMGTMLLERGLKSGECPELLSLTRPEVLEEIARLYFAAGAEILETNTFGASPLKLARYGLESKMDDINRAAVRAVRKVVGNGAYVAACIGPSGRMLRPYGDTDPAEIYESYRRQLAALVEAGIDCVCIETMTDLAEAVLAVKAAKAVSPTLPVTATMTFDPTPRGYYTIMGVNVAQAAAGLQEGGADLVGSNCGNGIDHMVKIAEEFRRHSTLPLIIQPNAGLPEIKEGRPVYGETPEYMADRAGGLVALGVSVIGGCCGTTPEHTQAIRKVVDELTKR
jgi:5-methyltetrahydrofolate--homocysteine methyltransferase